MNYESPSSESFKLDILLSQHYIHSNMNEFNICTHHIHINWTHRFQSILLLHTKFSLYKILLSNERGKEREREEKAHVSAKTVTIQCVCVSAKMCGAFRFVCKFCLELYTLRSSCRFLSVSLCSALYTLHAFMHVFITVLFTLSELMGERARERETPFKQNQSMNRGVLWNNFISIYMSVCSICVCENL